MKLPWVPLALIAIAGGCSASPPPVATVGSASPSPPPAATTTVAATPPDAPQPAAAAPSASTDRPAIVQAGAPVLRARARDVAPEAIPTPEIQSLIARMIETMRAAPGVGLAAPQIGVPLRVIVLEDRADLIAKGTPAEAAERGRTPFGPRVFINPVLTPIGSERAKFFEGCLSVDGYAGVVERHLEVEVRGLDEHGKAVTWRVRGWPARILQHEVDHVDGTLYVDRMDTRSFSTREQAKQLYGGKPMAEILRMLEVRDPAR